VLYLSAEWPVVAVEFLSDGRLLAAIGGADTVVVLLDSASSDPLRTYRGNVAQIRSMDVAPDESHFATGAEDGSVRIFRLVEEIPVASVAAHTGTVTALAFARDGRTIHSGDGRGSLATVDVAQAAVTDLRDAHAGAINGIAISGDGRYMVTASSDSTLRLWGFDAENYTELSAFAYPSDQLDVQLDLPSNRIYSSTADGSVIGWRFRTVSSAGAGDADARAVSIAPRPARDAAVLTLATRSIGTVGVELIDMLGTRVWSHRTNGPTTAIQLDLSGISPGLYFVRVTLENGAVVGDVLVVR
jgi:WD40 repeat protein